MKKIIIVLITIIIIEIVLIIITIKRNKKIQNKLQATTIPTEKEKNQEETIETKQKEQQNNIEVKDDTLNLDELFKTISIVQQDYDFDFGLKEENKK